MLANGWKVHRPQLSSVCCEKKRIIKCDPSSLSTEGLALKLVSHQSRSAALLTDSGVGIDGSIIWAGEHKKAVPPAVPSTAPRAAGALAFY
ncbi:hypothetical protein KOW79_003881 [Hemibagrus wyckioides]|uniref:Uncharacterized protein n=1 Tax=Hemibagrus wyckioides TaxID=337641 RepID=A0A9D3SPU5_9TELE|nr:hypothetical protein KOW79_003881 [Hemibagrus wyckioides]